MRKFFMRNAPETIRDAQSLSKEDFTEKYKETTATIEIISKAYDEIRLKHPVKSMPPPEPPKSKSVTFKVQPIHNKKPVPEPVVIHEIPDDPCGEVDEIELSHELTIEVDMLAAKRESDFSIGASENRGNQLINAARGRDKSGVNEDEIKTITPGGKRGRKPLPEKDKRDARIKELLLSGKKGKDIVEIMKEEGYSVHAPQVTQIKATLDKED